MNINITDILNSFKNIKNILNIVILKCYDILFTKNGIIKNYGFYMIISILFLHFVFIIIFYIKYLKLIKEKIKKIIYGIQNWYLVKREENRKRKIESEKLKQERLKKKKLKNLKKIKIKKKAVLKCLFLMIIIVHVNFQILF